MSIQGRGLRVEGHRDALEIAMRWRGITTIRKLLDALERSATAESDLCEGPLALMREILEPPCCQKTHCEHHTVFGFASCAKALAPSRCRDHREYLTRRQERACPACKGKGERHRRGNSLTCAQCGGTGRRKKDARPHHFVLQCRPDGSKRYPTAAAARRDCPRGSMRGSCLYRSAYGAVCKTLRRLGTADTKG